jgi:hypothetical protein
MGALMWAVGVILTAGATVIVGVLVWWANFRLRAWEGTIATT